jgi:hypothetical protein
VSRYVDGYVDACASIRSAHGFKAVAAELLTAQSANFKLNKSVEATVGLSLAPAWSFSGSLSTCPWSTPACRDGCVAKSGKGAYPSVVRAREWRTDLFYSSRELFVAQLAHELRRAKVKAGMDRPLYVRLNTFSDIRWERVLGAEFWSEFTEANGYRFYDYSKAPISRWSSLPSNYRVVKSASRERLSVDAIATLVDCGFHVAVVFDVGTLPKGSRLSANATWHGMRVIDGDVQDNRYDEFDGSSGAVVVLRAKGPMRRGGASNPMVFEFSEKVSC